MNKPFPFDLHREMIFARIGNPMQLLVIRDFVELSNFPNEGNTVFLSRNLY